MTISVVIPAFNEEKRIGLCLKSIQNQSVAPFEIIVVDNNSTDNTAKIAKEMGAKVIFEKNQGISFARNAGFNNAKGEIIARTDADTIVPSNWIEVINQHFEKDDKLDALSGPAVFGLNVLTPLVRFLVFEANKRIFGHDTLYGPNLAIRKSTWERIKNYLCMDDEKVHEVYDISIHIGKSGKIVFDKSLKVRTSARRLRHNPSTLLVDYLVKWADMIAYHKQYRVTRFASSIKDRITN